jgi:NAD(P)-dependent dehydrogenase (short-subunit alcohol dehydrogenase family)
MNPTLQLFDLHGRTSLITGGSRGLGFGLAKAFAVAGADVVVSSRHEKDLKRAVEELKKCALGSVNYCVADMTRRGDVKDLAATALTVMGRVDILINNAGSNFPQACDEISDAVWDDLLELNLTSCMALTRELVPSMKREKWGRIIYVSSIMALASKAGRSTYSATKAALIGMARAQALELGPFNITVNCLTPGPFETDLANSVLSQEQKALFARRTALGRYGAVGELTGPAVLLASQAGSFVTGATLVVDGGTLCNTF